MKKIFIHDFFCFYIFQNDNLTPISIEKIKKYLINLPKSEDSNKEVDEDQDQEKEKETKTLNFIKNLTLQVFETKINKDIDDDFAKQIPKRSDTFLSLEHNLVILILYISIGMSGYPILPKDILFWIKNHDIPYLEGYKDLKTPEM